jgi:hypothetical protein
MSNDFIPFAVGGSANVTPQATYAANTTLTQTGFQSGIAKSPDLNKVWRQSSIMSAVLAQFIANTTGQNAVDDGTTATLLANLIAAVSANSEALIGSARNLSMSVTAASASATMTADEIVVGSALGGLKYTLASFSKTINLATTGAGGMDTGTAPVSGYVALYAIWNPTTQTAALLATNATSVVAPSVYGGANMPSGYTASALVSVVPTNSSSQFPLLFVKDRRIAFPAATIINATGTLPTAISYATLTLTAVPKNARSMRGAIFITNAAAAVTHVGIAPNNYGSSTTAPGFVEISDNTSGAQGLSGMFDVDIGAPQTVGYYSISTSGVTVTYTIITSSYEI